MLKEIQGISNKKGFIILGNSQRYEIDYVPYYQTFFKIKEELEKLRNLSEEKEHLVPKPVLCYFCSSCHGDIYV